MVKGHGNRGRDGAFWGAGGMGNGSGPGEGGIGGGLLCHILTHILGLLVLPWAAQTSISKIAGRNLSSPIEQAGALLGVRGEISPLPQGDLQPFPKQRWMQAMSGGHESPLCHHSLRLGCQLAY